MSKVLRIHNDDNVWVALEDLHPDEVVRIAGTEVPIISTVQAKHKVAATDIPKGGLITMYGTTVGKALQPIFKGTSITTENTIHATAEVTQADTTYEWNGPDVSAWQNRTFSGYHRKDGKVGTRNHWLFIPLVFCENRNIRVLQDSLLEPLGYHNRRSQVMDVKPLIQAIQKGSSYADLSVEKKTFSESSDRVFPNVDGIKFLTHEGGCGESRQDSEMLCKLLATYISNSNVGGATILSLGCQNAQIRILQDFLEELSPDLGKPVYFFEQQSSKSEKEFLSQILKSTFDGLQQINKIERKPASISHITLGLECGGSDGFSGISANPSLGHCSDLLVALGGTTILSEFPELHGAEQELVNRCKSEAMAEKFVTLMEKYNQRAKADGTGFESNPSPGNIRDGLITDAIKSLGAAKKGGTSMISGVMDYGEIATQPGLNLLCTPGNDVESTTGLAGSGANLIVFTTGLGTPTGNVISPTLKMSTNNALAQRMSDIIDINAGTVVTGEHTIEQKGEELLELLIRTASGEYFPAAERLGQDDFIPWKRGISL